MTKILCAEDNADNLFMLQRRLTRAGFEVNTAMNHPHFGVAAVSADYFRGHGFAPLQPG